MDSTITNSPMKSKHWLRIVAVFTAACILIYLTLGLLLDQEFHQKKTLKDFRLKVLRVGGSSSFSIPEFLIHLGFLAQPRLYPQAHHEEFDDLPVFVAAAESKTANNFMDFIISQRMYFPDKKLVVYSLDLSKRQIKIMRDICRCVVREVQWSSYPQLITENKHLNLHRPIIIQEALMEFGSIFWCDTWTRFTSSEIFTNQNQAERVGLIGWSMAPPTSAVTHPAMFQFFNTTAQEYRYHRPIRVSELLIYNTETVHHQIMKPWLHCVLDIECVAPSGAKNTGCDFNKKPGYSYSGCHGYYMSALNIILGQTYRFETPYLALMDLFKIEKNKNASTDWFS